jgi:YrbI family 3-deoxy-D-manno-octulosonate 8-phosphate phosphatase
MIKTIFSDFDGVMTDGRVILTSDGAEHIVCDKRDGHGVQIAKEYNVDVIVVSRSKCDAMRHRCDHLGIMLLAGIEDKRLCVSELMRTRGLNREEVAWLCDDVMDLDVVDLCGVSYCPRDAMDEVKRRCVVLGADGGRGFFRAAIEQMVMSGRICHRPEERLAFCF